jgi:hypothetical protein
VQDAGSDEVFEKMLIMFQDVYVPQRDSLDIFL